MNGELRGTPYIGGYGKHEHPEFDRAAGALRTKDPAETAKGNGQRGENLVQNSPGLLIIPEVGFA